MNGDIIQKAQQVVEKVPDSALIVSGSGVSGGLITLPLWVKTLSAWAAALSPIIGLLVAALTAWLLILKIAKRYKE